MIKNGARHMASLKDGRQVYLNGRIVGDVTEHAAFRQSVRSIGALYDFQCDPTRREVMTFTPEDGAREPANRYWQMATSQAELIRRRQALESWAESHMGFLGRSPDHVGSCIAGMAMGIEVFEQYDKRRAGALMDYYRFARDRDLYLTYVIINPQADRSKPAAQQRTEDLVAGIVDQDSQGITLRGAKMLATGGIMANEVLVTSIQPLQPGEERYAFTCALPMNAKGLKILSRKSYEENAGNVFDYPLSSRFDENDALIYFDDVKVPWDRVFIAGDVAMCQKQFHATPAHVYQNYQAQVRLVAKLRFLLGIGHRIAETNGIINFPQVRETLGQLAAEVGMVDGMVAAMEAKGRQQGRYFVPDRHTLYSAQVITQQLYGRFITAIRELAGGGLIMLPSSVDDFANPELAGLIDKTQQSPAADSRSKVKFYRMAWDALGSEFASRHAQYEMFYAGASFVTKGHSFRTFDWKRSSEMVDRFMSGYDLDAVLKDRKPAAAAE
jgi:4-hydroxyphenylacetate 3-monooxygenase